MVDDPKVFTSEPTPMVHAVIIGTGDGSTPIASGTVAVTPGGMSNLIMRSITPAVALSVRFANTFFVTLSGTFGATFIPGTVIHGTNFKNVALIALSAATADLLKNLVTIFGKLEGKYPLQTGSV